MDVDYRAHCSPAWQMLQHIVYRLPSDALAGVDLLNFRLWLGNLEKEFDHKLISPHSICVKSLELMDSPTATYSCVDTHVNNLPFFVSFSQVKMTGVKMSEVLRLF